MVSGAHDPRRHFYPFLRRRQQLYPQKFELEDDSKFGASFWGLGQQLASFRGKKIIKFLGCFFCFEFKKKNMDILSLPSRKLTCLDIFTGEFSYHHEKSTKLGHPSVFVGNHFPSAPNHKEIPEDR